MCPQTPDSSCHPPTHVHRASSTTLPRERLSRHMTSPQVSTSTGSLGAMVLTAATAVEECSGAEKKKGYDTTN